MRNRYVCFDEDTGQIFHDVYYLDAELPAEARANHKQFDADGEPSLYYVEKNTFKLKPLKPSPYHQFDYTTKQWIDPRTPDTEWPLVRAKRDKLLLATDWTQLPDVPLATKGIWSVYRQALRDVTLQADPFNIVWPVAP